MYNYKKGGCNL